ncbi:sensor domain-containing protein [Mycobacterium sp. OTB74]|uniref:sensor domain-containing protein n=1 Tax=Mycobacterium sp. OTB74 TaxID=1853452 RepID=UPI002476A95C|nr:sensor domain-containing protein [Mycobacterium sp. OTB74]MDH6245496.1 hypothetical protein [Mycobacterium sp. OTB74]
MAAAIDVGGARTRTSCAAGVFIAVTLALTGCSAPLSGHATKAAGPAPARPIEQLAPTADEMSEALGSVMKPALVRSSDAITLLPDGIGDTTPAACVGAKMGGMRQTYAQAPVTAAQTGSWDTSTDGNMFPRPEFHVRVAIVELKTSAAASSLHRQFVSQWQQCQATPIVEHNVATVGSTFTDQITAVAEHDGLLTAIDMQSTDNRYDVHTDPQPIERAVAIAGRFLIDVDVDNTDGIPRNVIPPDHAVAVAKLIVSKITSNT